MAEENCSNGSILAKKYGLKTVKSIQTLIAIFHPAPVRVRTYRKALIFHKAMQSTNLPAAAPVPVRTNRKALIRRLLVREDTNQGGGLPKDTNHGGGKLLKWVNFSQKIRAENC
jgi:hypothetical protein